MHWFKKFGATMDQFRLDVQSEMEDENMNDATFAKLMSNWIANQQKLNPSSSTESKEARTAATTKGVIKGDASGKEMWKSYVTREQLVIILKRLGLI
jgi:hypothetical protein